MAGKYHGAREFLDLIVKLCRLSHTPGFVLGLQTIMGINEAADVYTAWTTVCNIIDLAVAADDHFNQVDTVNEGDAGGEDISGL